jgi:hypothetical protein
MEKVKCDCGKMINGREMYRHIKTKAHLTNSTKKDVVINEENVMNDYVKEINPPVIIEEKPLHSIDEKIDYYNEILPNNELNDNPTKNLFNIDDLYDSNGGCELIGVNHHLIYKIKQYKLTFPEELKKIKIRQNNLTKEYLDNVLNEIDIILSCGSIENIFFSSLFSFLHFTESIVENYDYINYSGLAQNLRSNPQFLKIGKQLILKYGSVGSMPPEFQLGLIIISSAYLQIENNKLANSLN